MLERNGFEVIVPPQVCCGLPLISNGLYGAARGRARNNLAVLAGYARAGYRIVGTSTSCTHTLKAEYREMLDIDDGDARAVADATWDICEFLLDLHEQGRLDTRFGELDRTLPYHAPCQLRSHGIGLPALDLFALVPGLRAIDMDHDCCGIAGTYGLKSEKYDIAMAVGAPLFERIRASGAGQAACDSETCRWQIAAATDAKLLHPVEILAEAYAAGAVVILVIGAGAVGSFLGWTLASGGQTVSSCAVERRTWVAGRERWLVPARRRQPRGTVEVTIAGSAEATSQGSVPELDPDRGQDARPGRRDRDGHLNGRG